MKSELAGVVTIPWVAVTKVSAEQPLHVGLKDGQTVVGAVTTSADNTKFEIATKETGVVTTARESVQFMRSNEEQTAYQKEVDRYRNPRIVDLWAGNLDIGFATTQGNAKTSSFNLSGAANRAVFVRTSLAIQVLAQPAVPPRELLLAADLLSTAPVPRSEDLL